MLYTRTQTIFCQHSRWKFLPVLSYRKISLFFIHIMNKDIHRSELLSHVPQRDLTHKELLWSPCLKELSALKQLYHVTFDVPGWCKVLSRSFSTDTNSVQEQSLYGNIQCKLEVQSPNVNSVLFMSMRHHIIAREWQLNILWSLLLVS